NCSSSRTSRPVSSLASRTAASASDSPASTNPPGSAHPWGGFFRSTSTILWSGRRMTQSRVGKGFRWLVGFLGGGVAGWGATREAGVYELSSGLVERSPCPEAPPPTGSWEGQVEIYGNEVQISFFDPRLFTTAGERALVGRFFFERE